MPDRQRSGGGGGGGGRSWRPSSCIMSALSYATVRLKSMRFHLPDHLKPRPYYLKRFLLVFIFLTAFFLFLSLTNSDLTLVQRKAPTPVQFHDLQFSFSSKIQVKLFGSEGKDSLLLGIVGRTVKTDDYTILKQSNGELLVDFPSGGARLTVRHNKSRTVARELSCYNISWDSYEGKLSKLQDLFSMKDAHWYGGTVVKQPLWPTSRIQRSPRPFITGDSCNDFFGSVQERFWMASNGVSLHVDYDVPLFVGLNESGDGMLNFVSTFAKPYGNSRSRNLFLSYAICQAENITATFLGAVGKFWRKPFDIPDRNTFRYPIWSTWAAFKKGINQTKVINFARTINEKGFKHSHLVIDDGWATNQGDFQFNLKKFPNPVDMVNTLKTSLGFRVTLWVHPFASPFTNAIWQKDSKGNRMCVPYKHVNFPAIMSWWNGLGAIRDLTNPESLDLFQDTLKRLTKEYGVDSFKFDGGESGWLSSWGKPMNPLDNRNDYTKLFINVAYNSDTTLRLQEIRVGVSSQHYPIFVRLLDKDSHWGYTNGIRSVIPHMLLFGVIGYPFLLPDMIGGNAYSFFTIEYTSWPERELYIRWLEVVALLPAMQFSVVPWLYDDEVVRICHKMCALHEKYADKIIALAEESTRTGAPIIRPLWWIAPRDEEALQVDTEFLLGDDLLVAPVLEQGARTRDIYLPAGQWKDELNGGSVLEGGRWHRDYKVLIDELAHFTLIRS